MITASGYGHTEIVQLLLSHPGIEIDCINIRIPKSFMEFKFIYFTTFLYFTSFIRFHAIFKIHQTALSMAQHYGHQRIVELLSHANQN